MIPSHPLPVVNLPEVLDALSEQTSIMCTLTGICFQKLKFKSEDEYEYLWRSTVGLDLTSDEVLAAHGELVVIFVPVQRLVQQERAARLAKGSADAL